MGNKKIDTMRKTFVTLMLILFWTGISLAAHPLITDDAGTQGKGRFQLEINGQYGHDREDGATVNSTQLAATLTYGIIDNLDVALGIPYQFIRTKDGEGAVSEDGISDISISLKWRFYEKDKWSFALKPTVTLPSGSENRGLGTGRATYSLFFVTTRELEPFAFHLNVGYIRNENKLDQTVDVWHASLATEYKVIKDLRLVANIGMQRNPVKIIHTHPAFLLGGFIYSLSESLDIDVGYKSSLNKHEVDHTALAGITWRF